MLVLLLASVYQISQRSTLQNQAQTTGPACRNIVVDCVIGVPDNADPADYIFDVCVIDNHNPQSFFGGCVTVNGGGTQIGASGLNGASSFKVRVPIVSQYQSTEDIAKTQVKCDVTVKKKNESCERRIEGNYASLDACQLEAEQCEDCKCVESGELISAHNKGAIRYIPALPAQPTPTLACYGDCNGVVVTQQGGRKITLACGEIDWIGEGGDATDACVTYTFNKERTDKNGQPHLCEVPPEDGLGCSREICCKSDPKEACEIAKELNTVSPPLCVVESECEFELIPDQSSDCPTCDQTVLGINQPVNLRLTNLTRPSGYTFEFDWGRFGEGFKPIDPHDLTYTEKYTKGGIYKLTLLCKDGDKVVSKCTKYVPVVCATCGNNPPTPSPTKPVNVPPSPSPTVTSTTTPTPTGILTPTITSPVPNSCPLIKPINIQFSLNCKNCGLSPTPTQ